MREPHVRPPGAGSPAAPAAARLRTAGRSSGRRPTCSSGPHRAALLVAHATPPHTSPPAAQNVAGATTSPSVPTDLRREGAGPESHRGRSAGPVGLCPSGWGRGSAGRRRPAAAVRRRGRPRSTPQPRPAPTASRSVRRRTASTTAEPTSTPASVTAAAACGPANAGSAPPAGAGTLPGAPAAAGSPPGSTCPAWPYRRGACADQVEQQCLGAAGAGLAELLARQPLPQQPLGDLVPAGENAALRPQGGRDDLGLHHRLDGQGERRIQAQPVVPQHAEADGHRVAERGVRVRVEEAADPALEVAPVAGLVHRPERRAQVAHHLRHPGDVLPAGHHQQLDQGEPLLERELAAHAQVDHLDVAGAEVDQDVAGVRVAVEEAVHQQLLDRTLQEPLGQPDRVDPGGPDRGHVDDRHPVDEVHRQHPGRTTVHCGSWGCPHRTRPGPWRPGAGRCTPRCSSRARSARCGRTRRRSRPARPPGPRPPAAPGSGSGSS